MRHRRVVIALCLTIVALAYICFRTATGIDSCLDGGGRWDYGEGVCDMGPADPE